jgi:RHS repeat-associated protein
VFRWTPTLAAASRWRVYARWIQFTNHATNAKYRVFHAGGETIITVNQQQDGSRWVELGDFDFAPGASHRVEIRDDGNGYVIADAVRLVKLADSKFVAADAVRFIKNDAEALLYVHADHLGRPRKMTNTARQVVWDAQYAPFGEEHALAGAAFNDERFPGQLWDEETGFHYNYVRDYDPRIGRYLQSDPIGLRGGLNTYGYVGGNPVNAIDPTGERTCLKWLFRWCIKWAQEFPGASAPKPKPGPSAGGGGGPDQCKDERESARRAKGRLAIPAWLRYLACISKGTPPLPDTPIPTPDPDVSDPPGPKPQVDEGQQGKHQPGHPNFDPTRSELTHPDPQGLLDRYGGTGQSLNDIPVGQPGSRERVDFGEVIGNYRPSDYTGPGFPTDRGIIHYGTDRAHIVPARPAGFPH